MDLVAMESRSFLYGGTYRRTDDWQVEEAENADRVEATLSRSESRYQVPTDEDGGSIGARMMGPGK